MMIDYKAGISDITTDFYFSKRSKKYKLPVSDTVYTFDIEVSSLFKINGVWQRFNYDIADYTDIQKVAIPYIWMFGIEDNVYFGRELWDFESVLKQISDDNMYKVIWVHNLSYEMIFLMNIFHKNYTITDVIARDVKKPIEFRIKELNIIFRCSYMLTNLSLDNAAKEYTNIRKKVGDLDYNVERSPLTKLNDTELGYCEYDIRVLTALIRHYIKEYDHIFHIPLTSTGTVRKALKESTSVWYIKKMQKLVPEAKIYMMLWLAFSGGYTHANILHAGRVFKDGIESEDESSAYPGALVTEMYPCSNFIKCSKKQFFNSKKRASYAFLIKVHFTNVKSRFYNHYMQASKCLDLKNAVIDNGRIVSCDSCNMVITDVDYDIITQNYKCDVDILECYKAKKDYLDLEVIKFILNLYKNKTTLKGVDDKIAIYKRDKARLNSCFGMAVTNQLKNSCDFSNDVWTTKAFTNSFIEKKLDEMKNSYSTLFYYATGVWCTAYARRNLYQKIVISSHKMDKDVFYCDTDSCKFRNPDQHLDLFLSYNLEMIEKYRSVMQKYDELSLDDFMPKDKDGKMHPIGFYEFDGYYTEFCTHGAKKYCYREDGKLHITVAGVSKKGVSALNDDINNFKKGFTWNYYTSGKKTHYYRELHLVNGEVKDDLQKDFTFIDVDGNKYESKYKWSIILMPTTYTLGITDKYAALIKEICEKERCKNE